ncbi:solute symporter family protein [Rhodoluna lacicola]|jgi:cation/acetate symporter|uniref:Putative symporter n=1 Tax=Rhodoluna lacicola TaxID=529884 RepID=A0A060JKR1_9MICO|nr:cation acetate symporter [Rhodoluna lacicola]AIC47153.1 putative symporter [Rhodoluna lacicola]BDS50055.1 cation acetate symporter [Rhodoluna lacicola]
MSSTTLSAILFVAFVVFTLVLVFRAGRSNKQSSDFYDGGGGFSGFQNGLAIAGDYMSAASFLGIAGTIALFGYDGFLYSIGFLVAWLVALLLVAEPLRNSGRFTMGDVLAFRMRQRPVRGAAATSTLVVSIFYLMAQMVGAGALVSLLLGINDPSAKNWIIGGVGILMIVYVTVGGMKGTTYVQIVKAFLLMTGAILLTVMVLWQFGFNISDLLGAARDASGKGDAFLQPGLKFGKDVIDATTGAIDPVKTLISKLDLISLGMALVLGTAGLPHILIRFYTVPTSKAARKSVNWAIGNIGAFYLMTIALGFGAAALVSRATLFRGYKVDANGCLMDAKGAAIMSGDVACTPLDGLKNLTPEAKALLVPVDPSGNVAAPQLAQFLGGGEGTTGGAIMLAVIGAIAFATILAVVAGLTLASSSSFAHDLYANVIKKGTASPAEEVRVAKISAVVIGGISIVLAIGAQGLNVAFLVAIAFAIAASGNLPAVLYSLFWKNFNTRGAVWSIYGGLFSAVVLLVFSPNVSGLPTSLIPFVEGGVRFDFFPLANPGIVSIPLGFLFGWLGTITSSERNLAKYAELEVRSMTGAAIGKAVQH